MLQKKKKKKQLCSFSKRGKPGHHTNVPPTWTHEAPSLKGHNFVKKNNNTSIAQPKSTMSNILRSMFYISGVN
jgi:hypothetical protein